MALVWGRGLLGSGGSIKQKGLPGDARHLGKRVLGLGYWRALVCGLGSD